MFDGFRERWCDLRETYVRLQQLLDQPVSGPVYNKMVFFEHRRDQAIGFLPKTAEEWSNSLDEIKRLLVEYQHSYPFWECYRTEYAWGTSDYFARMRSHYGDLGVIWYGLREGDSMRVHRHMIVCATERALAKRFRLEHEPDKFTNDIRKVVGSMSVDD